MTRRKVLASPIAIIGLLTVEAGAARSQTQGAPATDPDGNIWDYRAHQPSAGQARQREEGAGIAPSGAQQKAIDQEMQSITRSLDAETGAGNQPTGNR